MIVRYKEKQQLVKAITQQQDHKISLKLLLEVINRGCLTKHLIKTPMWCFSYSYFVKTNKQKQKNNLF